MRSIVAALLILPISASAQFSTATYTVTFEATWSAATHPDDFPPNPHFSGLIGAAHDASATLWEPGELASPGIESMAETGSKTLLEGEVELLITAGSAFAVLSGGGIATSPGSVSMTFDLNTDFPLVSLVSMVAPSPDWFVGVNGLELFHGSWMPSETITLYAYDAGTDSGTMYTSPDEDTQPPEPIALITGYPFFYDGNVREVGAFEFVLDGVVSSEGEAPMAADLHVFPPYPNPTRGESIIRLEVGRAQTVRLEILDLLGRFVGVVHDGALGEGSHSFRIETRQIPAGLYILRTVSSDLSKAQRLVVQ